MKQTIKIAILSALMVVSGSVMSANKPAMAVSDQALYPGNQTSGGNTIYTIDNYDFEAGEGFSPGLLDGQVGWTVFAASSVQPVIDTSDPSSGAQHVQIANDPNNGGGTLVGGFSPDLGAQPAGVENRVSVDVKITAGGGADYQVIGQAPSLGFLTWRVNLDWLGNIEVLDDTGGGLAFEDTGVPWPVNTYFNLQVITNPGGSPGIEYYLDGALIYSQVMMLSADNVEQVIVLSDNWQSSEVGNFDNLMIDTDYVEPAVPALPVPGLGTFGIILLSLGLLWTVRRKWVLS